MKLKYIKFEYKSMGASEASTNKLNMNINQAHLKSKFEYKFNIN